MFSIKIKRMIALLIVLAALVLAGIIGIFFGYNYVISQTENYAKLEAEIEDGSLYIDANTEGAVMVVVDSGDDSTAIAKKLKSLGLIDNTMIFSLMSKFNGFDGGYLAGTHFLVKDLTYDEMMYLLCQPPEVVTVTIPEGMTYIQVKAALHDAGLSFDDADLDAVMNSPNLFVDYDFVSQIVAEDGRDFILSGYLFPDTYEFDMNASPEAIVSTFLRNMDSKLYDEYYARATKLGMTLDQVITLASLIQSETTNVSDMLYISAVFHNRLNSGDPSLAILSSCASINYLREQAGLDRVWAASSSDMLWDSPYNTYLYAGLPPGPICMPGEDAIQAALYPEPNCNYLYFCATGIDGGTAFAVTAAEQQKNVEKYSANWTDTSVSDTTDTTDAEQ